MSFMWAPVLALFVLVPVGVAAYVWLGRRRRRRIAGFGLLRIGAGGSGQSNASRTSGVLRALPGVVVLVGLTVMIAALARPQAAVGLPRDEGTIILAFDVSGSMAADDLKPTRMEAAKVAAREFVLRQPASVVIGVVAFSDGGFSVQVPTNEQESVLAAIDRLTPQRGTSLAQGIEVSLNTIAIAEGDPNQGYYTNRSPEPTLKATAVAPGTHKSAVIVLLTDGENTVNPDPAAAAQAAADRGVRVYTVGIGSTSGTTLQVEGFTVHTELNEGMLRQIADTTGGAYYGADNQEGLRDIYATLDTRLVVKAEEIEVTGIFAGASIVLLLVGCLTSLFWLGRLP